MALRKVELKTPMPYCLHHNIELKTIVLEAKHCAEKSCPHLVFVKQIWTAPQKELKL